MSLKSLNQTNEWWNETKRTKDKLEESLPTVPRSWALTWIIREQSQL
jgi:hypothetical protein